MELKEIKSPKLIEEKLKELESKIYEQYAHDRWRYFRMYSK